MLAPASIIRAASLALAAAGCLAGADSRVRNTSASGLIDAIREQDRARVASLISEHVDVNAAQPDGAAPLSWAVYLDEADVVDELMRAGAKPDSVDEYGETPLTLACATGNFAIMKKLIDAGTDVKAARWNGETALMIAARSGSVEGVKLLLARGARIDAAEMRKNQNALMWAAAEGHGGVVKLLIADGADVKAISTGGFTPLVFATQKGDAESVNALLNAGLTPDYTLPNGTDVLHVAVAGGNPEVVKALLARNAGVNLTDQAGFAPLHLAAQSGNLEIVKMLLTRGANANAVTGKVVVPSGRNASAIRAQAGQQTALLLAAKANHPKVMRALIDAGADPKIKAQDGSTLLMAAAGSGHIETVKYAYELDPDVNAITTRHSAVMHAAVTGTLQVATQAEICDVIRFLAEKGADVDPEDVNGRTPIVIANFLPIDQAVTLMTQLITDSGKTPKKSPKR